MDKMGTNEGSSISDILNREKLERIESDITQLNDRRFYSSDRFSFIYAGIALTVVRLLFLAVKKYLSI